MPEVVLVARSKGVSIPDDYGDDRMKFAASSSQTFKSSLLHDLERGNRRRQSKHRLGQGLG
jgi:ketopantoate reductase